MAGLLRSPDEFHFAISFEELRYYNGIHHLSVLLSTLLVSWVDFPSLNVRNCFEEIFSIYPLIADDSAEELERDQRISVLQTRIIEIRKVYMELKAEVALIDRRRKRARRKEREGENKKRKFVGTPYEFIENTKLR